MRYNPYLFVNAKAKNFDGEIVDVKVGITVCPDNLIMRRRFFQRPFILERDEELAQRFVNYYFRNLRVDYHNLLYDKPNGSWGILYDKKKVFRKSELEKMIKELEKKAL